MSEDEKADSMLKEDTTKEENFASRYIVDVSIAPTYIMLGDSSRAKYYIDSNNKECVEDFKRWFKVIFTQGIPGKLTVFQYKKVKHEGQIVNVIDKLLPISFVVPESSSAQAKPQT